MFISKYPNFLTFYCKHYQHTIIIIIKILKLKINIFILMEFKMEAVLIYYLIM